MRRFLLAPLALLTLALAACSSESTNIAAENRNPLTAQRYGEELADTLANLIIQQNDVAKDPASVEKIQEAIERAKDIADEADRRMQGGTKGPFLRMETAVEGYALYKDSALYFSPDFYTKPGIDLRVYMSEVSDPRDVTFPDPSAVDLGPVQRIEGAQVYAVPQTQEPGKYLSVVLFERSLGLLYGFAQIR